ncbi:MAG TPA: hypothetical protein V6C78_02540 [Crinalium sp.]|jgi:hypothetical protein
MASQDEVRRYLAYWFQLGKSVSVKNGRETFLPRPVLQRDRYSPEFESCWQYILENAEVCHLEGTDQTIAQLLDPLWAIHPCARCEMPVPILDIGAMEAACPCSDLSFWPDSERPQPRGPVSSYNQLVQIRDRLLNAGQRAKTPSNTDT